MKKRNSTTSNGVASTSTAGKELKKDPIATTCSKEGETTAEFRRLVVQEQVRSLRRRLWHAFQNEDEATALRAYKATARDLQAWVREEIQQAKEAQESRLQEEKEKKGAQRPAMMKKLSLSTRMHTGSSSTSAKKQQSGHAQSESQSKPNRMSFRRKSQTGAEKSRETSLFTKMKKPPPSSPSPTTVPTPSETELLMADTTNSENALLPMHMNPSDPFLLDDYKDPTYEICPETGEPRSIASINDPAANETSSPTNQLETRQKHFKAFRKRKSRASRQPRTPTTSFWASLKLLERRGNRDAATAAAALSADDPSEMLDPSESTSPDSVTNNPNDIQTIALTDPKMTTPLHEAARLGNAELVRLMLAHPFVEPNFKNGQKRTALHMVTGGWTEPEERLWRILQQKMKTKLNHKKKLAGSLKSAAVQANLGISAPVPIDVELEDAAENGDNGHSLVGAKKAARAMSRFFHTTFKHSNKHRDDNSKDDVKSDASVESQGYLVWDEQLWNQLRTGRMDCLLALLTWFRPDDGSASAGEGASINAVDGQGRTALHYAAELGREDICMAVLSSFGAMLTVVDDSARTPCELAAEQNHPDLAAQLEARALLYSDPYGMDDELLAAVMAEQNLPDDNDLDVSESENIAIVKARLSLAAPFSWFRTLSMDDVDKDRTKRIADFCKGMMSHVKALEEENELKKVMYGMEADEEDDATKGEKTGGSEGVEEATDKNKIEPGSSIMNKETGVEDVSGDDDGEPANQETTDPVDPPGNEKKTEVSGEAPSTPKPKKVQGKPKDDPPGQSDRDEVSGGTIEQDKSRLSDDDILSLKSIQTAHIVQYLSCHGWIVQSALAAFTDSPIKAMEGAGVQLQAMLRAVERSQSKSDDVNEDSISTSNCLICFDEFDIADGNNWTHLANCSHSFCNTCLGDYLVDCARSRTTGLSVLCPHHECVIPMSQPEIKSLALNAETFSMLQKTANDNFIASAHDLRFCSHPGCEGIVKVSITPAMCKWNIGYEELSFAGAVCTAVHPAGKEEKSIEIPSSGPPPVTYEGVVDPQTTNARSPAPPMNAHRFCFGCGERKYHFPVTCECLEEWKKKMEDEIEQVHEDGDVPERDEKYGDIAQRLWMRANTRPCPKCKAPIEKNEGCNHMTCFNPQCKHEFCWICRKDWKLHNTATGGFFRCNRWQDEDNHDFYDAPPPPDQHPPAAATSAADTANDEVMNNPEVMAQTYGTAMHETRIAWKKAKEMKRFLHHYTRWNAHMESAALEKIMSENVCSRLAPVVDAAADYTCDPYFNFDGKGLSFVHAAFKELLECRSVLQHSYAYSFFKFESLAMKRMRHGKRLYNEKAAFEQMQSELEIVAEQMSDIVARSHLRATQTQILFLTVGASERRNEFSNLIFTLINEEKKRNQSGNLELKRPANRGAVPAVASANINRLNTATETMVVQGLATETPGDPNDEVEETETQQQAAQETVREALLASLEAFMANTEDPPTFVARVDAEVGGESDDGDDFETDEDDDEQFRSWACSACTYMNSSGRRCAMCGTPSGT